MSIPGSALALLGAGAATGFKIDRSLRFNSDDSAYLSRDMSSASSTYTFSTWIKRADVSGSDFQYIFASGAAGVAIHTSNTFYVFDGSSVQQTTAVFRDPSAWYHLVFSVNSGSFTLYVNGVNVKTGTAASLSTTANATSIGRYMGTGSALYYLDAYLAEIHFVDGTALAATDFGKDDSNGVWQPIDCKNDLTYGTNGFYLKFADNSSKAALGTDSSGNSNTWTVNNIVEAVAFGITSAASITSSQTISFPITYAATVTYEFFVKVTTASTYTYFAGETSSTWDIAINSSGNLLFGNFTGGWVTFNSTGLDDGSWHFVRLTTTGSSTSLYIDGTLFGTDASGGGVESENIVQITNTVYGGAFQIAHLRITTGGTPPTTGIPSISSMNQAAGTGGTLAFYDALDDIAGSGTKTSDGGNVTITMAAATASVDGSATDSLLDTPTNYEADSGNNGGNYATLNPLALGDNITLSNGNLEAGEASTSGHTWAKSTIGVKSGKWYVEITVDSATGPNAIGLTNYGSKHTGWIGADGSAVNQFNMIYNNGTTRQIFDGNVATTNYISGSQWSTGDVLQIAYDADNDKAWFGINNTWYQANGSSTTLSAVEAGNNATFVNFNYSSEYFFTTNHHDAAFTYNFGQRPFAYTPPTGYVSLCTQNLDPPTIADGSTVMDVVTYTGSASGGTFDIPNFSPDFLWSKNKASATNHILQDIVRGYGENKSLYTNLANNESGTQNIMSVSNNTVTYGTNNNFTGSMVSWAWNGGTSTVSNADGSITSSVCANTSAGFSIVSYTGNGAASATIGHGLNAAPEMIMVKNRDVGDHGAVYHVGTDATNPQNYFLKLFAGTNGTATRSDVGAMWNDTAPTSSVFSVGTEDNVNASTEDYIAYCWTPVEGYSAFGSYEGNGDPDGSFVFTGFKPRWIMGKRTDSANDWFIYDTERETFNVQDKTLYPNLNSVEDSGGYYYIDILSNGFKLRSTYAKVNGSGADYIYAAFAEHPFKTARAR